MSSLTSISKSHFEILSVAKSPFVSAVVTEKEWWADAEERVIGMVAQDNHDHDWCWIILGRDEKGLFRGIEWNVSLESQELASKELRLKLSEHSATAESVFPQGDTKGPRFEILAPVVPEKKMHRNFQHLKDDYQYSSARKVIQELAYAFKDVDGNYVKDFQSTGFNGRLWELYLFAFLYEQKFYLYRDFNRPDYCVSKYGFRLAIEAVTVNPTAGETPPTPRNAQETRFLLNDYMPLKFGSSLFSKLNKRYWELSHMKDIPLVFAIHDFHFGDSMTWTSTALIEYLYGLRLSVATSEDGVQRAAQTPIKEHVWKGKQCPSGFFQLPGAENVSAVLFSNASTLSKFNRMGKLAGFGNPDVVMFRRGFKENPDPDALKPVGFASKVEPGSYEELWSEDVRLFHNPTATRPIPNELFEGCSHTFFENGEFYQISDGERILVSHTFVVTPKQ